MKRKLEERQEQMGVKVEGTLAIEIHPDPFTYASVYQQVLRVSSEAAEIPEGYLVAPYVEPTVLNATHMCGTLDLRLGLEARRKFRICACVGNDFSLTFMLR